MNYIIYCPELDSYLFSFDFHGTPGKQDYRFESSEESAMLLTEREYEMICGELYRNPSFTCSPKHLQVFKVSPNTLTNV